ncbi:MAG TPA: nucleoside diphosphate kinase regulator [Paracoccus sp.]|nr:nucleoside diphosphate kinase regulator [Paracoccus sp. (in: a-proteobacteria)]
MSGSLRASRAIIDAELVERLESLAAAAMERFPEAAYPLVTKLSRARLVPASRLPSERATIGSTVRYRDEQSGREQVVTLAYPESADISKGIVSVLTPVGVALLGAAPGDACRWETRAGDERSASVLSVEPAAATV